MNEEAIKSLILSDPQMVQILKLVRDLHLPNCWIGAGFVRSKVWDYLHGYTQSTPIDDIDVIYYDDTNLDEAVEKQLEQKLKSFKDYNWSVKNQARMHLVNNDDKYDSTSDALAHWVETATAVAVRINDVDNLEILAPYGIDDLVNMIALISPKFTRDKQIFFTRIENKKWKQKWPKITVISPN